jgi:hypothetical protein
VECCSAHKLNHGLIPHEPAPRENSHSTISPNACQIPQKGQWFFSSFRNPAGYAPFHDVASPTWRTAVRSWWRCEYLFRTLSALSETRRSTLITSLGAETFTLTTADAPLGCCRRVASSTLPPRREFTSLFPCPRKRIRRRRSRREVKAVVLGGLGAWTSCRLCYRKRRELASFVRAYAQKETTRRRRVDSSLQITYIIGFLSKDYNNNRFRNLVNSLGGVG